MTSDAQKQAGWLLPSDLTPDDLLCVQMKIPANQLYRAAFMGAVTSLGRWFNWEKSYTEGDTRASVAAEYWRLLIDEHLDVGRCTASPIRTEYCCPPWLQGGPGCWTVDLADLDGTLNIIQRVDADYCETDAWCPPEEWIVQPESGGDSVSDVELNKLQEQIDELQAELDDTSDLAQTNNMIANGAISLARSLREDLIGSMRWYGSNQSIPAGWIPLAGQRILQGVGGTLDGEKLYNRVPAAWRDGDDVLLPSGVGHATPVGAVNAPGALVENYGQAINAFVSASGSGTTPEAVLMVGGRWLIYIGDAQIS